MLIVALLEPLARRARPGPARLALAAGIAVALATALFAAAARAAAPTIPQPAGLDDHVLDDVRRLAVGKGDAAPAAARVEVEIGRLDPRLRLAPCARVEPYLPPGVRPWGKSRIGLRCSAGPVPWNVYLPITVKVWAPGLVVAAGATAGSVLAGADLIEAEVDLAEEATPVVTDRRQAEGRVLARSLQPGQALRQGHLKLRQFFAAGETVKVTARGDGYTLEIEAQALNPGLEGNPARVRTESGRILTGTPSGERRLELAP